MTSTIICLVFITLVNGGHQTEVKSFRDLRECQRWVHQQEFMPAPHDQLYRQYWCATSGTPA